MSTKEGRTCRLGRRPDKQGPRYVLGNQDTNEKSATGKAKRQILNIKGDKFIGTWNVRTLYQAGQIDILLYQLERIKWSIIGISETRWTGCGEIEKGDSKILYSGREDNKHQEGVALILRKDAKNALIGYKTVSSRIIKARFRTNCGKMTVLQVYAPASTLAEEELDQFYEMLQEEIKNTARHDLLIVMGDFNAKVGKTWAKWNGAIGKFGYGEENERGQRLLNFCLNYDLVISNTIFYARKDKHKYTWESPDGRTKNMIDYIIVNKKWKSSILSCRSFTSADIGSDHQLVMAKIRLRLKKNQTPRTLKRLDIEKLDNEQIKLKFKDKLAEQVVNKKLLDGKEDMNKLWERIKEAYIGTAEEHIGYREKRKKPPWISQEVLQLSDDRKLLKHKKTLGDEETRKKYNRITKEIKKKSKQCKEDWISKKCEEVEKYKKQNDTRKLFQTVKEICGQFEAKTSIITDKRGKVIEGKEQVKNRWKEYFEELYRLDECKETDILKELKATNKEEGLENFTEEEVRMAIKALKSRKAPGVDNITAEILQAGEEHTTKIFHNLCNKIFEEENIPDEWGKAVIVPIHKKATKTDCSNYRGISLLSIPGKIYTKILQQRLRKYAEEILGEEQAGFRMGRSTIDQIFTIRQIIEKYSAANKKVYHNFIDFRQAFDSIWQEGLWQALRFYGIPEKLVTLLEKLYSKSLSAVRVDGELTDWFSIMIGTRQGCCLSPLLFNIVLEVVLQMAQKKIAEEEIGVCVYGKMVNNLRFADDIDLLATKSSKLQELTTEISKSGQKFGLEINATKTKTMITGKKTGQIK